MHRKKYFFLLIITIIISLFCFVVPSKAKTSDPLEICTDNGLQIYPSSIWNSNRREYFTVWYDEYAGSNNANNAGIYGMHIDPNGAQGDLFKIDSIIDTEDRNHSPQIAYDSRKDQYLITWHDETDDSLSRDICAALVSFNGNEGQIKILNIPKAEESQLHPKVAWNGEQFLIVWWDFRNGTFNPTDLKDADIYGIRLDPNGNVLDPDGLAICTDDSGQVDPVVAGYSAEGEKGWLVSWVDERNTSSGRDIYGAIVNRNGDLVKRSFPICIAEKDQENVRLAVGPSGFFMVWHDERLKGTQGQDGNTLGNYLIGARLSCDGGILTNAQNSPVIPIATVESGIFVPSIAYFRNSFLVTWHDDSKIKGARVSWEGYIFFGSIDEATGERKPFILSDPNTVSTNSAVAVTYSSTGDYNPDEKVLITWQVNDDNTSQDIWGALYTATKPPFLQWVGKGDFTEDGVHPESGEGGDEFTFKVKYKKSEEGSSTPLGSNVWIDRNRNGKLEMDEIFQMEADEDDSLIYQTEVPILYEYDGDPNDPDKDKVFYQFLFQDEFNMAIGDPNAEGDPAGENSITLTKKGAVPQLSWVGTGGYIQDGLDPGRVEVDTNNTFIFKVHYRDSDSDEPKIYQVWIDINRDNSFEGIWTDYDYDGKRDENEIISEKFDMEKETGSDYSAGITYSFEKDLAVNQIGPLGYRFYFDDGANVARGEPKNIHYLIITSTSEDCIHSGFKPQMKPDIALTDQGGMIVWQDLRNGELADPNVPQIQPDSKPQWFYQGSEIYGLLLDPENGAPATENGGEIQIGTTNKNQLNPRIAGFDNKFLVVWEDLRDGEIKTTGKIPGSGYENKDIYGQIIDIKDPNNRIHDFPIATYTMVNPLDPSYMDQSNPAVATSGDNRFLVVWDDGIGGSNYGKSIYGTIVSYDPNAGPKVHHDVDGYGLESCIIRNTKDHKKPAVAWANNARRYLVVWQDSGTSRLYANSLDPNGQVMGGLNILKCQFVDKEYNRKTGNPICIDYQTDMYSPAMASDGDRFLIVWEHKKEVTLSGKDIYGIFVNPNSIVLSTDQNDIISTDPNGRPYEVKDKDLLGEAKIPICTAKGDQTNPRVHWDKATGNYFVAWTSQPLYKDAKGEYEPGSDTDIRGVWMNANGQLIGKESKDSGWEICAMQGIQAEPVISGNGNIRRAVWTDERNNGFPPSSFIVDIFDGLSSDIYSSPLKSFLQTLDDEDFLTGINPTIGGNDTNYTFKVNYLGIAEDPDGHYEDPNLCQVWIDLDGDGEYDSGEKHTMTADPNDTNLEDGQIYVTEVSLTLPDDYTVTNWPIMIGYRFYFEDKEGFSSIGSANILKTFQMNAPLLSWTWEDNYHNGGVSPSSGQKDTTFEFRVRYQYVNLSDSDENTAHPDVELWIDFNQNGEYEYDEDETFRLTPESDGNYAEGKIFYYTLEGWHREGTYNYRFYSKHIKGGLAVGEPTQDHQFTIYDHILSEDWTIYTTTDGLASNHIQCLLSQGNTLWVGTDAGLNRFRNESWETITPENESGLASYYIVDMVLDSTSDVLYVGTTAGLSSYNGSSWKLYGKEDTDGIFEKDYITIGNLAFDKKDQAIWMIVQQTSEEYFEAIDIDTNIDINPDLIEISLVCYNISDNSWTKYTKENTSSHEGGGLPSEYIGDLAVDDNGDVWVSTVVITYSGEDETEFDPNLVSYEYKGLSRFEPDENKWTHYTTANGNSILKTNHLNKIIADKNGNLWVGGTSTVGEAATDGGLYQFDIKNEKWVEHFYKGQSGVNLGSNYIYALCADGPGLWIGTVPITEDDTDGGASFYDGSSWGDLFTTDSTGGGLVSNAITAIAVQGNKVWFGTPDGLSCKIIAPPLWLDWTHEPPFEDTGVFPATGYEGTLFKFCVLYGNSLPEQDAEDEKPAIAQLRVDPYNDGNYQVYDMDEVNPYDNDYTDGKKYYAILKGTKTGTYTYRFHFEHQDGSPAKGEPTTDHTFIIENIPGLIQQYITLELFPGESIQEAINNAIPGDVIIIHPGIYSENINFLDKGITLMSLDPNDPNTVADSIIDGGNAGSVITFNHEEKNDNILNGITLKGGRAHDGGGIYCISASPQIYNCTITQNEADHEGGGIYCRGSFSPSIYNCIISENSAYHGGGICCSEASTADITNCIIIDNSASCGGGIKIEDSSIPVITECSIVGNSADMGGGLYCKNYSSASIKNCIISENSANGGGGMYCLDSSSPHITNSEITENFATSGGGIFCYSYSSPCIINSVIADNSTAGNGCGMYCSWHSSPTIINCTITRNIAPGAEAIYCRNFSSPIITNCILWNDSWQEISLYSDSQPEVSYSNIQDGYGGKGNISSDPLFNDVNEKDYRLQSTSPCINAGAGNKALHVDKDGLHRPMGTGYDMGAYEFQENINDPSVSSNSSHANGYLTIYGLYGYQGSIETLYQPWTSLGFEVNYAHYSIGWGQQLLNQNNYSPSFMKWTPQSWNYNNNSSSFMSQQDYWPQQNNEYYSPQSYYNYYSFPNNYYSSLKNNITWIRSLPQFTHFPTLEANHSNYSQVWKTSAWSQKNYSSYLTNQQNYKQQQNNGYYANYLNKPLGQNINFSPNLYNSFSR